MERAVAKRGGDWTYPSVEQDRDYYINGTPVYALANGESACLIGAALHELGKFPARWDTRSATAVLSQSYGIKDRRLIAAARLAQCHQDAHRPWSEALLVYKTALKMGISQADGMTYGYVLRTAGLSPDDVYHGQVTAASSEVLKKMSDELTALTKSIAATAAEFAKIEEPTVTLSGAWCSSTATSLTFPIIEKPVFTWTGQANLYKKDHALTA